MKTRADVSPDLLLRLSRGVDEARRARNHVRAIIAMKNFVREDSISSCGPDPSAGEDGFSDSDRADCYRSQSDCQCPFDRFCASLSTEQKLGRARSTRGQMSVRWSVAAAGERDHRDFRLPVVLFSPADDKPARTIVVYEGNPTCPRRLPPAGATCATGSIRIRHCGILNSFPPAPVAPPIFLFFFFSLCADLTSRLRAAVVIRRKSIQLCKDRALEHRYTLHRPGEDVSFVIVDQSALLLPRWSAERDARANHAGNHARIVRIVLSLFQI